jgi:hypothetical protein
MFEFTIIAAGPDPEAEDFEARFYDAGCDDATVSFQKGHILIDFARAADSIEDALVSAIANVREAGAIVDRVEPDPLVSLADMASRASMTRGAMTNYYKGHRQRGFPAPKARVTTASPLWDWFEVSRWLFRHGRIDRSIALEAAVVSAANEILECGGDFPAALHERVAVREADLA